MKIILTNNSSSPIPHLMRMASEKIGYIYYLEPGCELEMTAIHAHKDGLITLKGDTCFSFSYDDFPRLKISYVPHK